MKPYTKFLRSVVFPTGSRFAGYGDVMPYLRSLEESQWWTNDQLRELQNRKLQRLMAHVYQYVPFYRRVMKERGLTPDDFQTTDDLVKLPITDKYVVTNNPNLLRDHSIPKNQLVEGLSSGSTGERLRYWTTRQQKATKWAGLFRWWEMAGYDFGDTYCTFQLSTNRVFKKFPPLEKLEWLLMRHLWLPVDKMTDEVLVDHVRQLEEIRPVLMRTYTSTAYYIAKRMNDLGLNVDVPAVLTTGETLSEYMRETIETAFAPGRVFNDYGGDGMQIAAECEYHDGMHINSESVFVEVVRNGERVPEGELGEIVLTNLEATATPFIRYNIQDVGSLDFSPCTCGRGLPRFSQLEGRLTDMFVTADGHWLTVFQFTDVLKRITSIQTYQVIQKEVDLILIKLKVYDDFSEADRQTVIDKCRHGLGPENRLEIEIVDEIPPAPSGKRRFFISEVIEGTGNTLDWQQNP